MTDWQYETAKLQSLWNPEVQSLIHKDSTVIHKLSLINRNHFIDNYLINNNFDVVFPSMASPS